MICVQVFQLGFCVTSLHRLCESVSPPAGFVGNLFMHEVPNRTPVRIELIEDKYVAKTQRAKCLLSSVFTTAKSVFYAAVLKNKV